jgi:hypothetical protein
LHSEVNVFGWTQIGVEYKLLACLCILGRRCYADNVYEILGIGNESVNKNKKIILTRRRASEGITATSDLYLESE